MKNARRLNAGDWTRGGSGFRKPNTCANGYLGSASATRDAPTAKSSCTSPARRTRLRAARRRFSRGSSRSPTRPSRGSPSGSASTATSPACTPSRSRASCLTRCGRRSRTSIGYSIFRTFSHYRGMIMQKANAVGVAVETVPKPRRNELQFFLGGKSGIRDIRRTRRLLLKITMHLRRKKRKLSCKTRKIEDADIHGI